MFSLPALAWLHTYRREWLRSDVIAAATLWALVVPQSIAYSQIAGLPPEAGLFATFAGLLGYGLLGTSRQLVVSPTSSTAAISAALIAPIAAGQAARYGALSAALAIMVGGALILLAYLNMGFISRFIAAGVQVGFMFGLGLTIIVGQLPKLFGIPGSEGDFFPQLNHLVDHLGDLNGWTVVLGFGSLAALLLLRRLLPVAPAALLCVIVGIVLVAALDLDSHGVAVMGSIDGAAPKLVLPFIELHDLKLLLPGALAIAVIGYAESASVAQNLADEHRQEIRPNQELMAIGGANLLSGLFQGFITGGGASQSAANDRAGAKTQLVSFIVSGLTVLTAIALLPLFKDLPQAVLGAIVISAVMSFLRVDSLIRLAHLRRDSFLIAVVALAAVLLLGVLSGLLVAVALTIVAVLERIARPGASLLGRLDGTSAYVSGQENERVRPVPGYLIYRLNAPLSFLNAKLVRDQVRERVHDATPGPEVVILDLSFSSDLDVESIDTLTALHRDLEESGVELWLANVRAAVRGMLHRSDLASTIGAAHIFLTIEAAMSHHPLAVNGGMQPEQAKAS